MSRNAIILAAGKSSRFAPFTYEKPKGLFRVKGEILIERQVNQMIEAGIREIYIIVGYMKEKFFYLEQRYPEVHLLINNQFSNKGNLYSLYIARDYLRDSYVSYADYYFPTNPFLNDITTHSYHAGSYRVGHFGTFALEYTDANVISCVNMGGHDQYDMVGPAYFTEEFSRRFVLYMNAEMDQFRISSLFWEEFYARHIHDLTLYLKPFEPGTIWEFNSIEDLRQFDSDFLYNVDSEIIEHICGVLKCHPNEISDIAVINAGLTNVSFRFLVGGTEYVYRHPGGTAGHLIDRQAEYFSQMAAKEQGVDSSVITMSLDGWKLSYCVQNLVECDFRKHPEQLQKGMEYLRRMHAIPVPQDGSLKVFDDYEEAMRLMKVASTTKGNLLREFADEIRKAERLHDYLKADAARMSIPMVCCHNDTYEPNFLATADGELYLIDWEYAGLNDPANDLACFFCRYDYSDAEIDTFIEAYLQRKPSPDEYRHYIGYIALCGFYWMGWGLYKGSVGDDDGFFFLPAYRNYHRFIDKALNAYEK